MARSVVVFGEDWGGHPSSTQHLFRRLGEDRDVVWVNSLGLRRPTLTRRDIVRAVTKIQKAVVGGPQTKKVIAKPSRLTTIDPRAISWPGNRLAAAVTRLAVGAQVRTALAQRRLHKPVLWASLPSAVSVLDACGGGPVIYYCGDDFSALAGVDHTPVRLLESQLVARADVVIAASDELASRFPRGKTLTLPHGVDFELFSEAAPRASDLPVGRPIAGFYGSVAEWLDIDMIAQAARALPGWDFVIIGNIETDVGPLLGLPNVRLLGPRPHAELPRYVQHWTVSLLPFRDTAQIRACNPLKLREYLAAGTPVVSTDFPALTPYKHLVAVGDPASFGSVIRQAADDPSFHQARKLAVATESWSARAKIVADLMESL
ncbi:glycosyltransferase [Methylocystis echinoides]|uniref:Glycosyl transferase n=1 Tax=Methylocystis echinoides TaxID=29468 RepID=A0A9W6GXZ1_9HYPH|nr:glycosyltransferase [Methylocystis echinoides]GLI94924.1 glycosyl transferase [Methylocystis echinoides]